MAKDDEDLELVVDSEDVEDEGEAAELDEELSEEAADEDTLDLAADDDLEGDDSVADALQLGSPLFLVHRGHQYSTVLPAVLRSIARRHGDEMSLGVIAPLPRMSPENIHRFFDESDVPIKIADPEAFARPDSFGRTLQAQQDRPFVGVTARHWDYFRATQPQGGTAEWVAQVLDAQRSVGATLLLTPGVWADPSTPADAIAVARQHVDWARNNVQADQHVAVNIMVTSPWLTTAALRERLLNELMDIDEDVVYLKVRWPLLAQPYGQLLDAALLDGYGEIANVFEENDKVLLLPNTGLTGWLALAWGAHGFSTGIGTGERAFADKRVIRIPRSRPRPIPTPRTFVPAIMHVTDFPTATLLDGLPNARPCQCPFCRRMRRNGQFDKALAGGHYLRRVGDATAALGIGEGGRRVAARRIVRRARMFAAAATRTVPLVEGNDPRHLADWAARLR
jgi:hypothetical protein